MIPSFPNEDKPAMPEPFQLSYPYYQAPYVTNMLGPPSSRFNRESQQPPPQRPRILNAWSPNGADPLSPPLSTATLPSVPPSQSQAAIDALRAENYEYKTGTDAEGRMITNRPELDQDYDPDEWMPAQRYNPADVQPAKLNPDFSEWDKKLWLQQKGKPLKPGRQMMVRKPKELIIPKSIGLPQRPTPVETKKQSTITLPVFDRLNTLYSKFEAVIKKPRQIPLVLRHPGAPVPTLMQTWRQWIQEEQQPAAALGAFIEWQDIQGKLAMILLAVGAFNLHTEAHPNQPLQELMTQTLQREWERLDTKQKRFLENKPDEEEEFVTSSAHLVDERFYADCTRYDIKMVEGPRIIMEREPDGTTKLLTADEYYLKDCIETEERWYKWFMDENPKATPLDAEKHLLNLRCRYIPPEKSLVFKIPGLEECRQQQKKKKEQTATIGKPLPTIDTESQLSSLAPSVPPTPKACNEQQQE